jgi:hypothetical protein
MTDWEGKDAGGKLDVAGIAGDTAGVEGQHKLGTFAFTCHIAVKAN